MSIPKPGEYTVEQLDALTKRIAQGVTRVEYPGIGGQNLVIYESLDKMMALRSQMIAELNAKGDKIAQPNAFRSVFEPR
jgi:hypothetical protein